MRIGLAASNALAVRSGASDYGISVEDRSRHSA